MKPLKVLLASLLVFSCSISYAQRTTLEKANLYYKLQSYAEAIPLLEKHLESKESLPARTKLAYSYQMLNQMMAAEAEYLKIVDKERVRSKVYFRYGQVLMSLEKYDEAKMWFLKYHALEPDEGEGQQMAIACDEVQYVEPFYPNVIYDAYAYNTDLDDTAPVVYNNGIVFSSDRNPGVKFLKQKSAATGRDYLRLYFAGFNEDGSLKAPKSFSSKINELNKNTANASFTADGSEIFFTKNGNVANKRNTYTMQLFTAVKGNGGRWKSAKQLAICRPNYNYMHPCISQDGQTLFFTTDGPSGEGGTDIYYSVKRKDGKWSKPRNLGPNINTSMNEGFPFLHADSKLYFCSKGHIGYGGYDIFMSEKDEAGQWKKAINIGKPFNSSHDDVSFYLKSDMSNGFFTSSREGGDDDIYIFKISDEPVELITPTVPTEKTKTEEGVTEPIPAQPFYNIIDLIMKVYSSLEPEMKDQYAGSLPIENNEALNSRVLSDETLLVKKEAHEQLLKSERSKMQELESNKNETEVVAGIDIADKTVVNQLLPFNAIKKHGKKNSLQTGMYCVLEKISYFPGEYLLNPSMTKELEPLASFLNDNPSVKVEVSAHTASIGYDENNLAISQKRAKAIFNYLLYKGIDAQRVRYIGFGETQLVNHCGNGVVCTEEEHMANERIEVRIVE